MIDQLGRWYPDYPGQQPTQDPAYLRAMQVQQQAQMQQVQAQQQQMSQPQPTQGRTQTGIIPVQNEQQARNWYVGAGQSVTFIDENAPYCYTKTMGFSQLDRPQFTRYRLVREDDAPQQPAQAAQPVQDTSHNQRQSSNTPEYALKAEVTALASALDSMKSNVIALRDKIDKIDADLYSDKEDGK